MFRRRTSSDNDARILIANSLVDIDPDYAVSASDLPNRGTGGSGYDLDTNVGTAANRKIHPSGSCLLFGASGDYVSTPDTAGNSITGDIDIRADIAPNNYSNFMQIVSKDDNSTNISYRLFMTNTGALSFSWSADGSTRNTITSSAGLASVIAAGNRLRVRATFDVDNGASGSDGNFYTSIDGGANWVQLGSTQTTAGVTSIFDGTAALMVGITNGTIDPFNGAVYSAQIYNGIDGTLAVDFDPTNYVSGTTFSSGGVTWTLNGNSRIQNTGHDTVSSIAGNALETASGQDIAVFTRYLVLRAFTSSPSGDQVFFDARSDSAKSVRLITDNSDSNKWALDAGGTPIVVDGAYDTNWHVITIVSNGANSLLRVSGVGEIEGNPGSEALDFGTLLADLSGSNGAPCEIARDITFNYAHSATQRSSIEGYLEAQYSV